MFAVGSRHALGSRGPFPAGEVVVGEIDRDGKVDVAILDREVRAFSIPDCAAPVASNSRDRF